MYFLHMNLIKSIPHLILDLFYPNTCLLCDQFIGSLNEAICETCREKFEPLPIKDRRNELEVSDGIDLAYSGWFFTGGIEDVIHSLKYNDRAKLGLELGRQLGHLISSNHFKAVDVVTAVPLHKIKHRDRGYNQAEWIGKGVAEQWQIPFSSELLKRNRFTVSQTTLDKEERKANMANAFEVNKLKNYNSIVIVDDVLTTGSTISACAFTLKNAGVETVHALTVSAPIVEDNQ